MNESSAGGQQQQVHRSPRLCRYYFSSGNCFFGDSCQFLHGNVGGDDSGAPGPAKFDSPAVSSSSSAAMNNTADNSGNIGNVSDLGFASFMSGGSGGAGGSLPVGSRLQTYINMNQQQQRLSQNGLSPAGCTTPVLPLSATGANNATSALENNNELPSGYGKHQQQNFSFPMSSNSSTGSTPHLYGHHHRHVAHPPPFSLTTGHHANSQHPSSHQQLHNFAPNNAVNRFGSPPAADVLIQNFSHVSLRASQTSTPALPHSVSTPSFNACNIDSLSLDGFQNIATNRNSRETPTPPNAIPFSNRQRMSKSPSIMSETPPMIVQEAIGGTTYFYNHDNSISSDVQQDLNQQQSTSLLPNFYVYSGPSANLFHFKPRGAGSSSFFIPNELKTDLMQRHLLTLAQNDAERHPDVPQEVDCYNQLVPLDYVPKNHIPSEKSRYFKYVTSVYKANSTKDGLAYCFRRIHGFRMSNLRSLGVIDAWKKIQHSNVVQITEVFTTKSFGDYSLVFVYHYYPGAETMKQRHFSGGAGSPSSVTSNGLRPAAYFMTDDAEAKRNRGNLVNKVSETLIWCYIIQLSSALRSVHSAGLAAHTVDPSKILMVGKSRLFLNCCGVHDVLTFDHSSTQTNNATLTQTYQQEDLVGLGRIVLSLACQNLPPVQRDQLQICVEHVHRNYSPDLKNLILYLLSPNRPKSVNDIMPMIGARFYTQLDASQMRIDMLENELSKELENGRLFRLLSKLGSVNERPEFNMDPQWSETGDKYLLKLFRDYLFHQVNEEGKPWLDMAHVVQCLNKLDASVPEKIMLTSRDQQNVLVVSYADLRRCLDQSFNELLRPAGVHKTVLHNNADSAQ